MCPMSISARTRQSTWSTEATGRSLTAPSPTEFHVKSCAYRRALQRHKVAPHWPAVSDEEFASFDSHRVASDYAETAETWKRMAREAGFAQTNELLTVPNGLA